MLGEMITDYPQLLQSSQVENFHSFHIFYLNFSLFRKPFQTCYILCLCLVLLTMGSPLISNFFISKFQLIQNYILVYVCAWSCGAWLPADLPPAAPPAPPDRRAGQPRPLRLLPLQPGPDTVLHTAYCPLQVHNRRTQNQSEPDVGHFLIRIIVMIE